MPTEDETEIFRLKVSEIVHSILRDRDLTVKEVQKIKDAIQASLELILSQHETKSKEIFTRIAVEQCMKAISEFKTELHKEKEEDAKEQKKEIRTSITIGIAILGALIGLIQFLLKILGVF
jgi:Pyruvate/2-oxoacid:ferredoxin oxidoreductase gamma subunit